MTDRETIRPFSPRQKRTSGERVRSEEIRQRWLALYQQVNDLYQQGGTILGIARPLHLGHRRVRHFVRSPQFPEWGKPAQTKSGLAPYRSYLQERWQQGCQETGSLWQELQARGFTGSRMMVCLSMGPVAKGRVNADCSKNTEPDQPNA